MKKCSGHAKKAADAVKKAHEAVKKYHQSLKDRRDESEGMGVKKKSAAQRKALKGKSVAKKREIIGGEKANYAERKKRAKK